MSGIRNARIPGCLVAAVALGFLPGCAARPPPAAAVVPAMPLVPAVAVAVAPVLVPDCDDARYDGLAVDDLATLESPDGDMGAVWLAVKEGVLGELIAAEKRMDAGGDHPGESLSLLSATHQVQAYPDGTHVFILELTPRIARVKVAAGKDPGAIGWIQRGLVERFIPPFDGPWLAWTPPPAESVSPPSPPRPARSLYDAMMEEKAAGRAEALATKTKRATSLLSSARNLERAGKTKAALDFYRRVLKDHPGTPQSAQAAGRIEAIGGK